MGIIYAQRDASGKIIGTYANPQPGFAEEAIYEDAPEALAFLNPPDTSIAGRCAAAYRDRRFAARLEEDPVGALVDRAKSERPT